GGASRRIDPRPRVRPEEDGLCAQIKRVRDRRWRPRPIRCSADAVPMLLLSHPIPVALAKLGVDRRVDEAPVSSAVDSGLIRAKAPHDDIIAVVSRAGIDLL